MFPALLAYEIGVLVVTPTAIATRNGADAWLRRALDMFGFRGYFLLPLITVALLLAWHHTTHEPWSVPKRVLPVMLVESVLFSLLLVFVAKAFGFLIFATNGEAFDGVYQSAKTLAVPLNQQNQLERIIAFLGAGIYEEVLFRLLLLTFFAWCLRIAGLNKKVQLIGAVVITSALFAGVHYIGIHGDPFEWQTFTFRFTAGALFAGIYIWRGLGIAAGAHTLYDLFVGISW